MGELFYLLMMLAGGMAAFARRGLIVAGDAAATASNLMVHPARWQLAIAGELLVVAFYFVVIALLYTLLKPAGRTVALVAAFVGLAACVPPEITARGRRDREIGVDRGEMATKSLTRPAPPRSTRADGSRKETRQRWPGAANPVRPGDQAARR